MVGVRPSSQPRSARTRSAAWPCSQTPRRAASSGGKPLREQRAEDARERVAGAARAQARIARGVDEEGLARRGDERARALEHERDVVLVHELARHGLALVRVEFAADEPRHFADVGREQNGTFGFA